MTLHLAGVIDVAELRVEVEITIGAGETVALVGPNGAGKTSVVRAIAGLHPLTDGRLVVDGEVWDDPGAQVFRPPSARRVGVMFQQYLLFPHMTAVENVAFGARAAGRDRAPARRDARQVLDRLGVGGIADQLPATLSGGEAQRVALARALAIEPEVLLLDEPIAALDASARGAVRHDLRHWIGDGAPTAAARSHRLIVTHDPVDAHALADRVVVLERGRVTQRGTMAELAAGPRSAYVADLMGTNLLHGVLAGSTLSVDGGGVLTVGAHTAPDGPVIAAIRPAAIALHAARPEGSPRNVWSTGIAGVDHGPDRVRIRLDRPLPLVAEVTPAGLDALAAGPGDPVWASVKASEIVVVDDA